MRDSVRRWLPGFLSVAFLSGCAEMAFNERQEERSKICQMVHEDRRAEVAALWNARKPDLNDRGTYRTHWLICIPNLEAYNYYKSIGIDPKRSYQVSYSYDETFGELAMRYGTPAAFMAVLIDGLQPGNKAWQWDYVAAKATDQRKWNEYYLDVASASHSEKLDMALEFGWRPEAAMLEKIRESSTNTQPQKHDAGISPEGKNSQSVSATGDAIGDLFSQLEKSPVDGKGEQQEQYRFLGKRIQSAEKKALSLESCRNGDSSSCEYLERNLTSLSPLRVQLANAISAGKTKRANFAAIRANAPCQLDDPDWRYTGQACAGTLAHGLGEAMHIDGELSFKGTIEKGHRVQGVLSVNGMPMYEGRLVNGKPEGAGICYFRGEPEECRYFQGMRVDALQKQRLEFAEQQELLRKQQQEMMAMRKEIADLRSRPAGNSGGRTIGNAVADQATDYVIRKLFDRLF